MPTADPTPRSRATRRLVAAVGISAGGVLAALIVPSGLLHLAGNGVPDALKKQYVARASVQAAARTGSRTLYLPDGSHIHLDGTVDSHGRLHRDPAVKNAVSRSAPTTNAETQDPTSPQQAEANRRAAAQQRAETGPPLTHVPVTTTSQPDVPTDRYNMFNACYGLQSSSSGRWLTGLDAPSFTGSSLDAASPTYFKPSHLGRYLLYSSDKTFLDGGQALARYVADPGETNDWTVDMPERGLFRFQVPGKGYLAEGADGRAVLDQTGTLMRLHKRSGCADFPEISTNVSGDPFAGTSKIQEVRGFVDAHTHGMAFEFLGGDVHCGRPWSPYGVTVALQDCPDHSQTNGYGAVMEDFLSGTTHHDPVGWPTFKDWPAPDSLTHEGTYYKWMERSWRAGQRILVNLLVENNQLCQIYPLKRNSCNDMDSIRLQAKDMHELQDYVDAQYGGPGKGWYRIVTTPEEARRVINAGKLAVVMGIETSVPFGCSEKEGIPQCSAASIDRQLDEVRTMGVSQMELVNKFDNALAGVAGDSGSTGYLVNSANMLETGSPWRMQTCNPNDPEVHDKDQDNSVPVDSGDIPAQDALFGAVAKISGVSLPAVPVYPAKHHCNRMGLTDLGDHTIRGLVARHMIFDPDHMSVKARQASLDLIDKLGYSGVISSHSWSTPDAYPRIYGEKGFITPYAGDSTGFVEKWRRHLTWANPKTYWGFGFGADINGLGAQGDPRPDAMSNHPVTYPFTTLGGVKVYQQVSGQRVYDINEDGVAHYGLYPDWIQDLKMLAGQDIVDDMARGPEAYLQMWERAYGIAPSACGYPGQRLSYRTFKKRLHRGMTDWSALQAVGQPDRRLGNTFSYCGRGGKVKVVFSSAGKVRAVRRA